MKGLLFRHPVLGGGTLPNTSPLPPPFTSPLPSSGKDTTHTLPPSSLSPPPSFPLPSGCCPRASVCTGFRLLADRGTWPTR